MLEGFPPLLYIKLKTTFSLPDGISPTNCFEFNNVGSSIGLKIRGSKLVPLIEIAIDVLVSEAEATFTFTFINSPGTIFGKFKVNDCSLSISKRLLSHLRPTLAGLNSSLSKN